MGSVFFLKYAEKFNRKGRKGFTQSSLEFFLLAKPQGRKAKKTKLYNN
jgi:hypothetical protein